MQTLTIALAGFIGGAVIGIGALALITRRALADFYSSHFLCIAERDRRGWCLRPLEASYRPRRKRLVAKALTAKPSERGQVDEALAELDSMTDSIQLPRDLSRSFDRWAQFTGDA